MDGVGAIDRAGFDRLVQLLLERGHRVVGPVVREGAVVLDELSQAAALPWGWVEEAEAAHYRLRRQPGAGAFAHSIGPQAWRRFLFPPKEELFRARPSDGGLELVLPKHDPRPLAFLGVRSCDVHAIAIQDRVFTGAGRNEPGYAQRRAEALIIAVSCSRSAATCFCASTNTGPRAESGFDLALHELPGGSRYLVEVGTAEGQRLWDLLPQQPAEPGDWNTVAAQVAGAAAQQVRALAPDAARVLAAATQHPGWEDVAQRCLSCANCTLVCPTCFCHTVEDHTELSGEAVRTRRWDSCFTSDFSHVVGGPVRESTASRYRQWLTHKLSFWHEQFGTSGCVGCGRCVAWCPAAIDLTREVEALRPKEAHDP